MLRQYTPQQPDHQKLKEPTERTMRRLTTSTLSCLLLLAAIPALAASPQGGAGDDGNPPATLNPGDENAPGSYAGAAFIEIRDVPITPTGTPSLVGGRFMRVTSRIGDGDSFRFLHADFVCGDDAVADPCTTITACVPGNGKKTVCEDVQVVDTRKAAEIQAVAISLIAPRIVAAFGLDPSTVMELTKLKKYIQSIGAFSDVDGVLSFGAVCDVGFDAQ